MVHLNIRILLIGKIIYNDNWKFFLKKKRLMKKSHHLRTSCFSYMLLYMLCILLCAFIIKYSRWVDDLEGFLKKFLYYVLSPNLELIRASNALFRASPFKTKGIYQQFLQWRKISPWLCLDHPGGWAGTGTWETEEIPSDSEMTERRRDTGESTGFNGKFLEAHSSPGWCFLS